LILIILTRATTTFFTPFCTSRYTLSICPKISPVFRFHRRFSPNTLHRPICGTPFAPPHWCCLFSIASLAPSLFRCPFGTAFLYRPFLLPLLRCPFSSTLLASPFCHRHFCVVPFTPPFWYRPLAAPYLFCPFCPSPSAPPLGTAPLAPDLWHRPFCFDRLAAPLQPHFFTTTLCAAPFILPHFGYATFVAPLWHRCFGTAPFAPSI